MDELLEAMYVQQKLFKHTARLCAVIKKACPAGSMEYELVDQASKALAKQQEIVDHLARVHLPVLQ